MKKILQVILVLVLLCGCSGKTKEETVPEETVTPVPTVETTPSPTPEETIDPAIQAEYDELNAAWDEKYHITHDYRGHLIVGSLIDIDVVQGETNDTYLRRDWETMNYDEEGSIFMDYRNTLEDENLIIYGHYVYTSWDASGTHKFTPLRELVNEENYDDNKTVTLQLENEIRTYEIAAVYYCSTYTADDGLVYPDEGLIYYYTEYPDDYFDTYIENVKENAFYDTGVEITREDKLLTLQTCVEFHDELREIVLCKEIDREQTREADSEENTLDHIG